MSTAGLRRRTGWSSRWRLDALAPAQRAQLARHAPPRTGEGVLPFAYRPLLVGLADGRRTATELAAFTSTSVSTARRRLNRVVDEGLLSFRCDAAPRITGWPVSATFRATVPPEQLDRTACALARLPGRSPGPTRVHDRPGPGSTPGPAHRSHLGASRRPSRSGSRSPRPVHAHGNDPDVRAKRWWRPADGW
ncbi:Lrp/AsnC family transcriptional regulator [Streptomyces phyllanthi]|uniref:Lrp/AsnC family transcriptional regulator n=1 Tax=Streptomyces phyllanthi TaxID=1803180 RepID=UPI0031E84E98